MRKMMWLFPLLLISCSCQKPPASDDATLADAQGALPARAAAAGAVGAEATLPATDAPGLLAAVRADAQDPASVVQAYIGHLLRGEAEAADAAWQFAPKGGHVDDAALRSLGDIQTMRINTGSPEARDQRQPTQLIEVPVRLRAVTADGTLRYTGWYRLVPDAKGAAWVIHSAQLQPVLD